MAETIGLNDRLRFSKAGAPGQTRSLQATKAVVAAFDRTNDGTVAIATVTAEEVGGRHHHTTILTLTAAPITHGDNANLATGVLIYTFPAGPLIVNVASINIGVTTATGAANGIADTPEIGLGTVIGSGANATLGAGAATQENIMAGANTPVLANMGGTAEVFTVASALVIETADAHTVHVNMADAYHADHTETTATITGTIILDWTFLGT